MERIDIVKELVGKSENYKRADSCEAFFELLYRYGRFCENCSWWNTKEKECALVLQLQADGKIPPSGVLRKYEENDGYKKD